MCALKWVASSNVAITPYVQRDWVSMITPFDWKPTESGWTNEAGEGEEGMKAESGRKLMKELCGINGINYSSSNTTLPPSNAGSIGG